MQLYFPDDEVWLNESTVKTMAGELNNFCSAVCAAEGSTHDSSTNYFSAQDNLMAAMMLKSLRLGWAARLEAGT